MKKLFTLSILFIILSSFAFATNLEDAILIKEDNTEYKVKGPFNIASYSMDIGSYTENPFIYLYSTNAHFTIGLHQLGGLEYFKINPGYENLDANHFAMDHKGNINMSENVNIGKNLLVQGTPIQKQIQPTICEYGIKYIDQSGAITCVGEENLNIPDNYTHNQPVNNINQNESCTDLFNAFLQKISTQNCEYGIKNININGEITCVESNSQNQELISNFQLTEEDIIIEEENITFVIG